MEVKDRLLIGKSGITDFQQKRRVVVSAAWVTPTIGFAVLPVHAETSVTTTTTVTTTPNPIPPDLTVGVQQNPSVVTVANPVSDITLNISNIGAGPTVGSLITVTLTANGGSYSNFTLPAGWTGSGDGSTVTFTSSNIIETGLANRAVLMMTWTGLGVVGVDELRAVITDGSGGEVEFSNNSDDAEIQTN